jgi:hypothetical protein
VLRVKGAKSLLLLGHPGYISTTHQSLLHSTLSPTIHFNGSNGTAYTRSSMVRNSIYICIAASKYNLWSRGKYTAVSEHNLWRRGICTSASKYNQWRRVQTAVFEQDLSSICLLLSQSTISERRGHRYFCTVILENDLVGRGPLCAAAPEYYLYWGGTAV